MKSFLKLVLFLAFVSFVFPLKSYADTSCQPIYGGGQSCITTNNIIVNKTVLNPQTNQFVDNLSINDPKYQPGFITTFQIAVTNTGNANISKINVKDIFPQYITFSSGPGNFDNNTKTLTFEVDNLSVNETRNFTILGRVVDSTQIPINQGDVVCVVNQTTATNLDNNSQVSQDNAQFCIQKILATTTTATTVTTTKGGFPVLSSVPTTSAPATGPEMFGLIALIPTGIAGWFLRKHSINSSRKG